MTKELEDVMRGALIGGNHLASILINRLGASDKDFPAYKEDPLKVSSMLEGETLDIWYAWRSIMLLRDVMQREGIIE